MDSSSMREYPEDHQTQPPLYSPLFLPLHPDYLRGNSLQRWLLSLLDSYCSREATLAPCSCSVDLQLLSSPSFPFSSSYWEVCSNLVFPPTPDNLGDQYCTDRIEGSRMVGPCRLEFYARDGSYGWAPWLCPPVVMYTYLILIQRLKIRHSLV